MKYENGIVNFWLLLLAMGEEDLARFGMEFSRLCGEKHGEMHSESNSF